MTKPKNIPKVDQVYLKNIYIGFTFKWGQHTFIVNNCYIKHCAQY